MTFSKGEDGKNSTAKYAQMRVVPDRWPFGSHHSCPRCSLGFVCTLIAKLFMGKSVNSHDFSVIYHLDNGDQAWMVWMVHEKGTQVEFCAWNLLLWHLIPGILIYQYPHLSNTSTVRIRFIISAPICFHSSLFVYVPS